jgi:hypothetical protein
MDLREAWERSRRLTGGLLGVLQESQRRAVYYRDQISGRFADRIKRHAFSLVGALLEQAGS